MFNGRFKPGSFTGDAFAHAAPVDCAGIAGRLGEPACEAVLIALCDASAAGEPATIGDLPRLTSLPLHEAFAAVRALEAARLVRIGDAPSDPLNAVAEVLAEGIARLANRPPQ